MTPRRVLLIVLAAIGASFLFVAALCYWSIPADEHAYWLAGQRLLAGQPLYDPTATSITPYAYWYPPIVAQVLAPDQRGRAVGGLQPGLDRADARAACGGWPAGTSWSRSRCAPSRRSPSSSCSRNVHLIIAVLLVLGLRRWSGWFSVGAAIKLAPVLGIPYLALRGRLRDALVASLFGAALLVVSVALAPELWRQFIDVLRARGPADASAFLPVPYAARFVVGAALTVVAARIEPRIGEPLLVVAVTIALPTLWFTALATLAAVVPLIRDPAPTPGLAGPTLAPAT